MLANNTTEYRTSQIEDTNGNFISINYVNNNDLHINRIVDTLGRVIQFNYVNGFLNTVAQLHSDGTPFRAYTFTLAPLTVNFNFTLPATAGLGITPGFLTSGQTSVNVLTRVTRPDNTSVVFDYAHDVNRTNATDNPDWVIPKSISELSSNGTIRASSSYLFPTASAQLTSNPTYTQQIVNDGKNTGTWTYQAALSSGLVTSFVSTDPCGTTQTTTFSSNGDSLDGIPIQSAISWNPPSPLPPGCSGSSQQNNLRTTNLVWALDSNGANPRVTSTTTILEDGVTQSQSKCVTFDAFGQCTDQKQYDFGNNQPGPLLREVLVSYASLGNNIATRPSDIQVKDGAGTLQSHQVFTYDVAGSVTDVASNPTGHDSAFFASYSGARGNLTSVLEYADAVHSAGGVTTVLTFDASGNILSFQRGSGPKLQGNFLATTQFAYPDSVSVGPSGSQLTTSVVYDLDRGVASTVTDPNGQKTTFSRDVDNRIVSAQTPDTLSSSSSYDDAAGNRSVTISNTANSLISKVTLDGQLPEPSMPMARRR